MIYYKKFSFALLMILLINLVLNFSFLNLYASNILIQHFNTKDNIKTLFIEQNEIPMVDISVVFKAGSAQSEIAGLANITNSLLDSGTKNYSENQIAENFANLGTNFSTNINKDFATLNIRSLSNDENLTQSINYLTDILQNPTFPSHVFNRVINQMIQSLKVDEQNPGDVAKKAFMKVLYPNHPYGIPSDGTIESLKTLKINQLIDFYNDYYVKPNANITIIGKINLNQAKTIANQISRSIKNGQKAKNIPDIKFNNKNLDNYIPFPSAQTHIMMGLPTITRKSDDYYALFLGNNILGGSNMSSILFSEIREKNGFAYSIYSYFSPMEQPGPFIIGMQTRNEEAINAINLTDNILQKFLKSGPSNQDIKDAKQNITGKFPISTASNTAKSNYLDLIAFYNLPYDYLDNFNKKINKITKKDIITKFNQYIKINKLARIAVGNSKELLEETKHS